MLVYKRSLQNPPPNELAYAMPQSQREDVPAFLVDLDHGSSS